MKKILLDLFLMLLLSFENAFGWEGVVKSISDGDTITIYPEFARETAVKVRLYGIDAPELKQEFGIESRECLKGLINDRVLKIETFGFDKYKRILGILYDGNGDDINQKMIQNGCAWVYAKYCKIPRCKDWVKDERKALQNKLGLWNGQEVTPPWKWRKMFKR
ncbi:MAG: thermonuclease family protein [Desulfovibrio sp.]|nr:thermonuclease family protein [Desulfovibrio sp.]